VKISRLNILSILCKEIGPQISLEHDLNQVSGFVTFRSQ
jgi:hypothetical protein